MAKKPERTSAPATNPTPPQLPERGSVPRKQEVVLRLLRGEPLDQVSRETQVPAHERERWQRRFLQGGQRGRQTKGDPEERELPLAKAKRGEGMMRLDRAEGLSETRGLRDAWKRA